MKFLHGYYPGFWEAYEKRGLLDGNSGIRFCQSIDIPENLKFNNLAAENGTFYNLVKDLRCSVYIDRLQGGCFFENYDYDMKLVGKYREMLGDDFYGFQMHEWMSNFVSDTRKLIKGNCPEPWTEKSVIETIKTEYDYEHVFTEAMSPAELAETGHIKDIYVYLDAMKNLLDKRQKYTGGKVLPCDSCMLGFPLEFRMGAERIMPEIGHQTRNTAIQVAFARGTAKAFKKDFGTYYEPWGGVPFSACNYHKNSENEWNIGEDSFPFKTAGGNGGSSRSLQKRMMLYSYASGASFFSEEWGAFNTFFDREDYELSPYGTIKLDFIRFMRKYPDIGKPLKPIAVVIPEEMEFLDEIYSTEPYWHGFVSPDSLVSKLKGMREGLGFLYGYSDGCGNENGSLVNMNLPDAFDIVNEDVFDAKNYEYAVNLTGKKDFEKEHRCVSAADVSYVLDSILPCKVEGGLHHFINENRAGECYLTIFNNTGIVRSVNDGEIQLKEAEKTVCVTLKDKRKLTMLEGDGNIVCENGRYFITVPAGGYFFGRF